MATQNKKMTPQERKQYLEELSGIRHARFLLQGRSRKLAYNTEDGRALEAINTLITRYEINLNLTANAELL